MGQAFGYFMSALRNYVNFSGRAQRSEYWYFWLFYVLIYVALDIIDGRVELLSSLFALGLFLPSIAVSIRRLHDIGRSGWWLLVSLIPVAGAIVMLVFAVTDSQAGDNAWGANPKGARH